MRTFLIWLSWGVLAVIGTTFLYTGFCLNKMCKKLDNTETWLENLLNESVDL